jgi:hypothetical protein
VKHACSVQDRGESQEEHARSALPGLPTLRRMGPGAPPPQGARLHDRRGTGEGSMAAKLSDFEDRDCRVEATLRTRLER